MSDIVVGSAMFVGIYACMVLANEERLRYEIRAKEAGIDRPHMRKVAKRWALATDCLRMVGYLLAFAFWSALNYQFSLAQLPYAGLLFLLSTAAVAGFVYGAIRFARWRLYKVLPEEKEKAEKRKRPGGGAKP